MYHAFNATLFCLRDDLMIIMILNDGTRELIIERPAIWFKGSNVCWRNVWFDEIDFGITNSLLAITFKSRICPKSALTILKNRLENFDFYGHLVLEDN